MKSVIPSARRMTSPFLLIALPKASMYREAPSIEALNSKVGEPWNASVLVMSKSTDGAVVRLIQPGTFVKNTVAGHQAESSHCICCSIIEPTAVPSLRYSSGTVISMEIAVPILACRSTDSGISSIMTSVLLPAALSIRSTCTQSNLSDRT